MVAPNYAAKRSALAKKMGLGRKRKEKPRGGRKRRQG
jgi:predicted transcriptional regulator